MSAELSEKRSSVSAWIEHAVFSLDSWLRRRYGVFEYTSEPRCLFRLERARADQTVSLADGTLVRLGDPILKLHLWNEHIPTMGERGPTVAWARQVSRAIDASLRELARYCAQRVELDNVAVICGDMHLGTVRQCSKLTRIVARYGFESVENCDGGPRGLLHRLGECILIFMLILATNPVTLRSAMVRRYYKRVFLSRATLDLRYAGAARAARASASAALRAPALPDLAHLNSFTSDGHAQTCQVPRQA